MRINAKFCLIINYINQFTNVRIISWEEKIRLYNF